VVLTVPVFSSCLCFFLLSFQRGFELAEASSRRAEREPYSLALFSAHEESRKHGKILKLTALLIDRLKTLKNKSVAIFSEREAVPRHIQLTPSFHGEWVRIAVVQLNFTLGEGPSLDGHPAYVHKERDKYRDKLVSILNELKKLTKPNLIVFPEYSIPYEFLKGLKSFADENEILIIAGSHQVIDPDHPRFNENLCPIIIPGKETIFCSKKTLSEFERDRIKASKEGGIELHFNIDEKEICFHILLCSDYLSIPINSIRIDKRRTGLIIVPMTSNNTTDFYSLANLHLRHPKGKFIVLCNSTGNIYNKMVAAGGSAIFGSAYGIEPGQPISSLNGGEGVLMANLNVLNPKLSRDFPTSLPAKGRINVADVRKYYLTSVENNWRLKPEIARFGVVNPAVLEEQKRRLRFGFLRVLRYDYVRRILKDKSSVGTYSVLGDFDIILESFEEETGSQREMIADLGISPLVEGSNFYRASRILRHEGHDPTKITEMFNLAEPEIEKINQLVLDWDTPSITNEWKEEVVKRSVILPKSEDDEVLTFIGIGIPGVITTEELDGFGNYLLNRLGIYDIDVKGLYQLLGPPFFHYLLKAGFRSMDSIRKAVDEIHSFQTELGFNIITRTYVVLEMIHYEPALLGRSKVEVKKVKPVVEQLSPHIADRVSNIFKRLSPTEVQIFSKLESKRKTEIIAADDKIRPRFELLSNSATKKELSDAETGFFRGMVKREIIDYCNSVSSLAISIERVLRKYLREEAINYFGNVKKAQIELGLGHKDTGKLSLFDVLDALLKWNEKSGAQVICKEPVERLRSSNLHKLRNICVHGMYDDLKPEDVEECFPEAYSALWEFVLWYNKTKNAQLPW